MVREVSGEPKDKIWWDMPIVEGLDYVVIWWNSRKVEVFRVGARRATRRTV